MTGLGRAGGTQEAGGTSIRNQRGRTPGSNASLAPLLGRISFSPFASYRLPSASPRFNGVDNRGVSPSLFIPRPDVFWRTEESLREIPHPPRSAWDDGPEKNSLALASRSFYAVSPRVRRYQLVEDFIHAGNGWRAICKRRRLSPHARGAAKTPSRAAGRHPPQ